MLLASRDIVQKTDEAWYWLAGISGVLFVGIMATLVYFVFKYSRKRHPQAADIHGNLKLEVTWIILPTIISVFLFYKGYEGFLLMRNPPENAYEIDVEARQWAWTFRYPEGGVTSSELYVPVNRPIKLNLTTPIDDVLHSLYIPAFRVKEDCVPGMWTYMWFEGDKVGTHNIFCAEFCGQDHAKMLSLLHVLSQDDYNEWLDKKIADRFKPVEAAGAMNPDSDEINACDAPRLYKTYCASCHGADGQGGMVEGARDFRKLEKWKQGTSILDIFKTLTKGVDGTQMRAFPNLSPWDRFAVAHYVASFAQKGRTDSTLEDCAQLIAEYKLDKPPVVERVFPIDAAMEEMAAEAANR
ncbi:MAG: cytochrome c oxidase subunit II [bacterium]|nr:cytochrome c oxidase subunit II [bacterium]